MSIDKHLREEGVEITANNSQPRGQRTQKHFQRLIAAVRAAEAESNDRVRRCEDRSRELAEQVIVLQEENHALKARLASIELKKKLDECEELPVSKKRELLEVSKS